jgi:ribosomal protein L11 methyltransferase
LIVSTRASDSEPDNQHMTGPQRNEKEQSDVSAEVPVTVVTVPAADAELGADRLMQAGAFAVEERVAARGMVELWAVLAESDASARRLLGKLPPEWSLRTELVDSTPADTWRAHAAPVRIAPDLVLRPAWLPPLGEQGVIEVAIDPGATFGLGDHPTTRLSAAAVWRTRPVPHHVLDVGAGSGVLAIVAVMAGAQSASAIDIADVSPAVVVENAERNGVADRITASTTPLAEADGAFDLVVANILAHELVALAADLRRVTADAGTLVVSGVLAGRYDHVLAALAPMELVGVDELDGWAALVLRHPRARVSGTRSIE